MDQQAPLTQFGASQAIPIFIGFIFVNFVFGFVASIVIRVGTTVSTGLQSLPLEFVPVAGIVSAAAGTVAGTVFLALVLRALLPAAEKGSRLAPLGWIRAGRRAILASVLAGIALSCAIQFLVVLVPPPESSKFGMLVQIVRAGGFPMYTWAFLAVFVAPPLEEFMFRGVLWTGFSRSWNPAIAAVVTTALFVAIHVSQTGPYWPALAGIALLGAAALAARILSGSLAPALALHASYNFVVCGLVIANL